MSTEANENGVGIESILSGISNESDALVDKATKAANDDKSLPSNEKPKQFKVACSRCKAAHRACKGGFPCKRCKKYKQEALCVPSVRRKRGPSQRSIEGIPFTGILPFHVKVPEDTIQGMYTEAPYTRPFTTIPATIHEYGGYGLPGNYPPLSSQKMSKPFLSSVNQTHTHPTFDPVFKSTSNEIFVTPHHSSTSSSCSQYSSYSDYTTISSTPGHHSSIDLATKELDAMNKLYNRSSRSFESEFSVVPSAGSRNHSLESSPFPLGAVEDLNSPSQSDIEGEKYSPMGLLTSTAATSRSPCIRSSTPNFQTEYPRPSSLSPPATRTSTAPVGSTGLFDQLYDN